MEIQLNVLVPIVGVLCLIFIVAIIVLCRLYLWQNIGGKKKHPYSKLNNPEETSQKQAIRPPNPPQYTVYKEQQSSRISDPPVFGVGSFNRPLSRLSSNESEFSATDFKKYAQVSETSDCKDTFNLDDNRSIVSSGSEFEAGSSQYSVQSDNFDAPQPAKLTKKLKTRFRSEPILHSYGDKISENGKSHCQKNRFRKIALSRSKSKVVSVIAPAAGQLEFTLFYEPDCKSLVINIIQFADIVLRPECFLGILEVHNRGSEFNADSMHLIRSADGTIELRGVSETGYFIYVTLLPKKTFMKHTDVTFTEHSAVFNEKFTLQCQTLEQLSHSYLCLHVLCKFGRDGEPIVLGEIKVPLKRLQVGQLLPFMANLSKPEDEIVLESSLKPATDLGSLEIYLAYNPMAQKLNVRIVQAAGLPKIGMTGNPNVSVKIAIYYCNLRTSKSTTSIQKRQRDPVFNETFEFELRKERISECDVLFEIRHHGPMYRSTIGYVIVGHSAGGEGSKQWKHLSDFSYHEKVFKILPTKPVGLN